MRLLATSLVAIATALLPISGSACTCRGLPQYDAIFEGRVIHIQTIPEQPRRYHEVRFLIHRHLKGTSEKEATVYTPAPVLMCGVSFEAEKSYVVYAKLVEGSYETLDCYGTKGK